MLEAHPTEAKTAMSPRRNFERRLQRLEKRLVETVSVGELREALVDLSLIALCYIRREEREAFIEELLVGAAPKHQLAFLDELYAAALRQDRSD